jgi:hypothetical protein
VVLLHALGGLAEDVGQRGAAGEHVARRLLRELGRAQAHDAHGVGRLAQLLLGKVPLVLLDDFDAQLGERRVGHDRLQRAPQRVERVDDHVHVLLLVQVGRAKHLKLLHANRAHRLQVVGNVLHLLERHRRLQGRREIERRGGCGGASKAATLSGKKEDIGAHNARAR